MCNNIRGEVELISKVRRMGGRDRRRNQAKRIMAALRIRPETLDELYGSLVMNRIEVRKRVDALR
jgi:hypothetical protein